MDLCSSTGCRKSLQNTIPSTRREVVASAATVIATIGSIDQPWLK